jgi:hypothetical protein
MLRRRSLALFLNLFFLNMLFSSTNSYAQLWGGILQPTYGTGACTLLPGSGPAGCAVDWTANSPVGSSGVGIPGGVPTRTTICTTIEASQYGNGSSDATSGIQSALNSCGTTHASDVNGSPGGVVLLGAGTFLLNGTLSIPSNVTLRGAGTTAATGTVLNAKRTSGAIVTIGTGGAPTTVTDITSGSTAGATSFTVASTSGISVGSLLEISEPNNPAYVSTISAQSTSNNCTWCDYSRWGASRVRGQIVVVTGISGNTINFSPPLYTAYSSASTPYSSSTTYAQGNVVVNSGNCYVYNNNTVSTGKTVSDTSYWTAMASCSPQAAYFTPSVQWAGLELVQVYSNGTASYGLQNTTAEGLYGAAYSWIRGIENNYSDGDHVQFVSCFRCEVRDSYFSNAYYHQAGQTDADVNMMEKTSASLVENNIMERLHTSMFFEYGSAGNVYAYNFSTGNFDTSVCSGNITPSSYCVTMMDFDLNHGAHPQFNLIEGNVMARDEGDVIHGSLSHNTHFRNWAWGTTFDCNPLQDGRGNYNCSSGAWTNQTLRSFEAPQVLGVAPGGTGDWYENAIGNVWGSAAQAALGTSYTGGSGGCTACQVSPTTRSYTAQPTDMTFGYGTAGDDTGGCSSRSTCTAYITAFLHGSYDYAANAVEVWQPGATHTLPASFFRSIQPFFWSSTIPWPAIGPDVTGGTGPGGHVSSITAGNPAQACWNTAPTLPDGSRAFDPTVCYAGGFTNPPTPPTNLNAVVQ